MIPPPLQAILDLFSGCTENTRRDLLLQFAEQSRALTPEPGSRYTVETIRCDAICTDTVGIHLQYDAEAGCRFRVTLGPEVQTLTRALAAILCRGLEGATPQEVLAVSPEIIDHCAGAVLVRQRSRTVYYMLSRMQEAVQQMLAQG